MRAFSGASPAVAAVLALVVSTVTAGCNQIGQLQARRALKAANAAYQGQDYKTAATLYEEAIQADPNMNEAYFYLGNSYDNMFRPSQKGTPENDALLDKAVQNYQTAADRLSNSENPQQKELGQLSLDYLVAVYGPDKLADPAKQEPIVQRMIQLDPSDPENYWKLAKIYEDAGAYVEAEEQYKHAEKVAPNNPQVFLQEAGYYSRQGELAKMFEALDKRTSLEPNNPEAWQMKAGYYEEAARTDTRLSPEEKRDYVTKGLEAVEKALQLNAEYVDALVFKNLLLRQQALLEKDPAVQKKLLAEADTLRDRAQELRKKQAGAAPTQ